jgi:hypothetical protein
MMEPIQTSYDTFSQWILTRLGMDISPNYIVSPLNRFFVYLYEDMRTEPGVYGIPPEAFAVFFATKAMSAEETTLHEALKAARMRVRKAVFAYLEFLFDLGKGGSPCEVGLQLARAEFAGLLAKYAKKIKPQVFLAALGRSGLIFSSGDPVVVTNSLFPEMPGALLSFSQACAKVKDFDFALFRRCDLAVLNGKKAPDIADALQMVPQPFRTEVAETDARLRQMGYKREIFIDGGDMTYRLRYNRKSDAVVYWVRILETFHPDLGHFLRWKLESDITPRLFAHLDETKPELAERVFAGLQACRHCYGENCLARAVIERNGVVKEVCKEDGWNQIGFSRADYEALWEVLEAFEAVL